MNEVCKHAQYKIFMHPPHVLIKCSHCGATAARMRSPGKPDWPPQLRVVERPAVNCAHRRAGLEQRRTPGRSTLQTREHCPDCGAATAWRAWPPKPAKKLRLVGGRRR
jgi:hypothetical protein